MLLHRLICFRVRSERASDFVPRRDRVIDNVRQEWITIRLPRRHDRAEQFEVVWRSALDPCRKEIGLNPDADTLRILHDQTTDNGRIFSEAEELLIIFPLRPMPSKVRQPLLRLDGPSAAGIKLSISFPRLD